MCSSLSLIDQVVPSRPASALENTRKRTYSAPATSSLPELDSNKRRHVDCPLDTTTTLIPLVLPPSVIPVPPRIEQNNDYIEGGDSFEMCATPLLLPSSILPPIWSVEEAVAQLLETMKARIREKSRKEAPGNA
ncbi:hypothetical protein BCR33DRAFT_730681 [Rhizoclosmatium globosum]|uniref:Uncharacterized protein n=1 Tax=Rhizoclosmatium globosum TaxID=329046 RepID=A0A1Y2ABK8_9FUNG|nr:hypothetical protein BCR33DRAFT_730681 [Rhizoclosmatium globosum]|eukprot:ORY19918.1 hypothetical protein BCR33DRAFT_730681 [Rhizoclosmatium globosum]